MVSGPQNTPRMPLPCAYLANLEAKHLLKVRRLADEKQVESPASAEIGHNDGVNWHGCKEGPPWRVEFLQKRSILFPLCHWLLFEHAQVRFCFNLPFLVITALGVGLQLLFSTAQIFCIDRKMREDHCSYRDWVLGRFANTFFDVFPLLVCDGGMSCRAFIRH